MRTAIRVLAIVSLLAVKAYAGGAHCYCKLGPLSAPVRDFGAIEHWNTQVGHDGACRDACAMRTDAFMKDPSQKATACTATQNGAVVLYYAVGTKPYQSGGSYSCTTAPSPTTQGDVIFPAPSGGTPWVVVNGFGFNPLNAPPALGLANVPSVAITFRDRLAYHTQRWSFIATLYRDNVVFERLIGLSSAVSATDAYVKFSDVPSGVARGHTWKITTHYTGPRYTDQTVTFFISP